MTNKLWNEWFEMVEKNSSEFFDQISKNQNYMKNLIKTYEPLFDAGKKINETRENFYNNLGLMTKEDYNHMIQKVQDVEIKMADILDKIEEQDILQKKIYNILVDVTKSNNNN